MPESPYFPKSAGDRPVDLKNLYISLPMAVSAVSAIVGGLLWYAVASADDEIAKAQSLSQENAKHIQVLTQQQALTNQQVQQILEATRETQRESRQTRETVIQIEASIRQGER